MENTQVQKKNMLPWIILGSILGFILLVVVVVFMSYVSANNYGNRIEQQLKAAKTNNQNVYANGTQKVLEIAQVPGVYKDDLKELITADIQGRYGKDGSKATMQFLKEHEVKLDAAMYTKIQQTVEGFRNDFQNNQSRMIDIKRSYETGLGNFWQGMWLRMAGYPKLNLDDYNPVITSKTEEVFKRGKEEGPLKLRP